MLYRLSTPTTTTLATITGRNLAHAHRSASERAAIAAQLVLGEAELVKPTITQIVPVAHVSKSYVRFALELTPATRDRVAVGEITLSEAAKANGLLSAWLAASSAEKVALGAVVGVNAVWDEVIAPSI
jgi:hypothetical protein